MITLLAAAQFSGLLIGFLYVVLALVIVAALIYCVDTFIYPIPGPIKLVLAVIVLILIIVWALKQFAGGL